MIGTNSDIASLGRFFLVVNSLLFLFGVGKLSHFLIAPHILHLAMDVLCGLSLLCALQW